MDIFIAPPVTAYLLQNLALLIISEHMPKEMFIVTVDGHVEDIETIITSTVNFK